MAATKKEPPPLPRVLIGNISAGQISTPTVKGFLEAQTSGIAVLLDEAPPYLDDARNTVVAKAFHVREQIPWDWLLFVDSDIAFTMNHLRTLFVPVAHPDYSPDTHPLLCGVYYNTFVEQVPGDDDGAAAWVDPVAYEWVRRQYPQDGPDGPLIWGSRRLSTLALAELPGVKAKWNPKDTYRRPVCAEVGAVGTGFMAIHHTLLTDLAAHHPQPTPYFAEPIINRAHLGEDIAFCHRVRALGYPVLVNRACVVLHGKTVWLP